MKYLLIFLAISLLSFGCSVARDSYESDRSSFRNAPMEKETAVSETIPAGNEIEKKNSPACSPPWIDVYLDTGENELAAYTLDVHYDKKVLAIEKIEKKDNGFEANISQAKQYAHGRTRMLGFKTGGESGKGRIPIARIYFKPAGKGKSKVSVSIKSLYDPDSRPTTGVVELSADQVIVK